jgi:Putative peptidoglycan binding domain
MTLSSRSRSSQASLSKTRPSLRNRRRVRIIAAAAVVVGATGAWAAEPVPAMYDGKSTTYEILPGSQLRSGDSLLSAIVFTMKPGDVVRSNGACTQFVCPVTFNNQNLFARRSRLRLPDGTVLPPKAPTVASTIKDKVTAVFGGQIKKTLRRGDQGADVMRLQEALNKTGAQLTVDKNYGRGTRDAVMAYQKTKNLKADGIAGSATLRSLGL